MKDYNKEKGGKMKKQEKRERKESKILNELVEVEYDHNYWVKKGIINASTAS